MLNISITQMVDKIHEEINDLKKEKSLRRGKQWYKYHKAVDKTIANLEKIKNNILKLVDLELAVANEYCKVCTSEKKS